MCYYSVMYCEDGKMKDRSIPESKIKLELAKLRVKKFKKRIENLIIVKETSPIYERI